MLSAATLWQRKFWRGLHWGIPILHSVGDQMTCHLAMQGATFDDSVCVSVYVCVSVCVIRKANAQD